MDMVVTPVALNCRYYNSHDDLADLGVSLARFRFDARCANREGGYREGDYSLSTGLLPLDGNHQGELFIGADNTGITHDYGAHSYRVETDQYLLLVLLAAATERLYGELLEQTRARGYPHLIRVWNYFADINGEEQGLERYRQFCLGRFDAFTAAGIHESQFPSACALGHRGGDLLIYALASKAPARHFENPRQASAYHYPTEYGPRSPSFARASLHSLPGQVPKLFVSGTASVVGFVTLHPYSLSEQITVTLENLDLLLAHVVQQSASATGELPLLQAEVLKVYVRNTADLDEIKTRVEQAYPGVSVVYVAADICRADLLLEIDGIWNLLA
jgi:chorismate lyase/3-hydroxybenzoate synthase